MRLALNTSSLEVGHKFRGIGFYTEHLSHALKEFYPQHEYLFYSKPNELIGKWDLVHYPHFDPFFLTIPLIKKYPTVITIHDLIPLVFPDHFPAGMRGNMKWQIQKNLLRNIDAVITDSIASKNDILKLTSIPENKIHVTYLAAPKHFIKKAYHRDEIQSLKDKYSLPDRFVLYVGDATWNKNLVHIVQAIKSINIPLVLVGKTLGDTNIDENNLWDKSLIKTKSLIAEDKLFMTLGFVPLEDLSKIYNVATLLAMPSFHEGFGLPVIEAMQSGCPVVTSKLSSLSEVAGEAAYYVDPYSLENIAKGISEVFNNDKLRKVLIDKGLKQAKKFSWKHTADETIKVYEKVLAQ